MTYLSVSFVSIKLTYDMWKLLLRYLVLLFFLLFFRWYPIGSEWNFDFIFVLEVSLDWWFWCSNMHRWYVQQLKVIFYIQKHKLSCLTTIDESELFSPSWAIHVKLRKLSSVHRLVDISSSRAGRIGMYLSVCFFFFRFLSHNQRVQHITASFFIIQLSS